MRTPQTCKYCDYKTKPEKCPHFERKSGKLPDNGRCKKFKKSKIRLISPERREDGTP
jgi:hypothetical protein